MQDKNIHIIDQQNKTFWFEGSPLALCSVTFFKNIDDGHLYVDALFQNEQSNEISSAAVRILCYDTSRKLLTPAVNYTYSQLSCTRNGCFGDACNIKISNTNTRFVEVILMSVTDINGNKWENKKEQKFDISLQQGNIYSALGKYYPIFHDICKEQNIHPEVLMFDPNVSNNNYWLCACGCFNWPTEKKCVFCQTPRRFLETYIQTDNLDKRFQQMNEEEKRQSAERLKDFLKHQNERLDPEFIRMRNIQLTKQRNKWIRKRIFKIVLPIIIILALILGGYAIYECVIKPPLMYSQAQSIMASGDYEKAAAAFENLGEYNNSPEQVLNAKYQSALQNYNNGNISAAVQILSTLGNYMGASDICKKYQYDLAEKMLNDNHIDEALGLYAVVGDYADAVQKYKKCQKLLYQSAYTAYQNSEYDTALRLLKKLPDYSPAVELRKTLFTMEQILSPCLNGENFAVWSVENLICPTCNHETLSYTLNFYANGNYVFVTQCINENHNYKSTLSGSYTLISGMFSDTAHNLSSKIISVQTVNPNDHNGKNTAIMMQNPFSPKKTLTVYGNIITDDAIKIEN
ncbi:MAG: tetratricopeptide repeat protein [Acutalibacteraceae bacterium]